MRFYIAHLQCAWIFLGAIGCQPPDDIHETGDATGVAGTSGDTTTGVPAGCGDGVVVAPEACDDGNALDGDSCNSDCRISGSRIWCRAEVGDEGQGGGNVGRALAIDGEGDVVVVGTAYDSGTGEDAAVVVKYTSDGSLRWTRPLPGEARALGVVIRADDSIVVSTDQRMYQVSAAGEVTHTGPILGEWSFDYDGLAISPAGTIAFAANSVGPEPRGVIGALRDDLSVRWSRPVDDLGAKTEARTIAAGPNRRWLVGGTVVVKSIEHGDTGVQEITEGFVRTYDAEGELVWSRRIASPDASYGYALTAVRPGATDQVVTLGILTNNTIVDAPNLVLTIVGPTGDIVAQETLATDQLAVYGRDLVVPEGGGSIVAGTNWPADDSPSHGFVDRYDGAGELLWSFRSALVPGRGSDFTAMREDAGGDLVVTGLQILESAPATKLLVCKISR